ncbi:UDP-glucuronosyl/UDP-glucosyltransferase [Corchorus olitorius]|uniref:UDP-glucuronosyl/UDP-glucosyltransferase n=1 Tax=Corchorus olitorius TaxID=93759 RepID=A0A1R3G0K3_9ROSI|nr:UDP-glucuronosyl/UDP-glucosyltransferase [Corchorus olitorius]
MDKQIHVLVVTYPAQGHVGPLMKLSNLIADRGIKVTVVTAESIHARVLSVFSSKQGEFNSHIRIVSIPDGSDQLKDKKDRNEFIKGMWRVMPGQLEELIRKMNSSEEEKISCVIADAIVGWAFEIAEKMGVKSAMFWPSTLESISLSLQIPKLIEDGILDHDGN